MNYREWLVYRARQHETEETEPEILRYTTWQNHQAVRDWMRRAGAAHEIGSSPPRHHAGASHA